MTEIKTLDDLTLLSELNLSDDAKDFLTTPYREAFMTAFTLGSNKFKFYGNPLDMAKNSELIEGMLPKLAARGHNDRSPHELFTFMEITEQVATLVWLALRGYTDYIDECSASCSEHLQIYQLLSYLGMNMKHFRSDNATYTFVQLTDEEIKKILENKKNEDILVHAFNNCLEEQVCDLYEVRYDDISYMLDEALFVRLNGLRPELINPSKTESPVTRGLNYIPIFIRQQDSADRPTDHYKTYADRKIVDNPDLFIEHNGRHWTKKDDKYEYPLSETTTATFSIDHWGPDKIVFKAPGGLDVEKVRMNHIVVSSA